MPLSTSEFAALQAFPPTYSGPNNKSLESISKPLSFPVQDVRGAFLEASPRLRVAFAVLATTTLCLGILAGLGAGGVYGL